MKVNQRSSILINERSELSSTSESESNREGQLAARHSAWSWIPTLYFTSGLPYVIVANISTVLYKNLGVSNTDIAAYTSDLLWPWVLKPFWSPLVDILGTQRRWIVAMQALMAAALLGIAFILPSANFMVGTLACFWLLAIASATHDIAADGFYMSSMAESDQAWFVGIRSTFYRLAMIVGSGVVVWLVGALAGDLKIGEDGPTADQIQQYVSAWTPVVFGLAIILFIITAYHQFLLPKPEQTKNKKKTVGSLPAEFVETITSFFQKPMIGLSVTYLLLYRFSEAQLTKLKAPFLLDPVEQGGLALNNQTLGFLDGTIGITLLVVGGVLGGLIVARDGLRPWIFPMALAINLPNACYAYLAWAQPESNLLIGLAIAIEQFGYGFGFAGYMLYMLHLSRGEHQTAHYAICTGFMALGMVIPGRFSGMIQESLGYTNFFLWILVATIPSLVITLLAPLNEPDKQELTNADE